MSYCEKMDTTMIFEVYLSQFCPFLWTQSCVCSPFFFQIYTELKKFLLHHDFACCIAIYLISMYVKSIYPSSKFTGVQKSDRHSYPVTVEIKVT
jgi:hypothetical protein